MMAGQPRLKQLRIKNYRSVDEWVTVAFPEKAPLVVIGENNAGKSNVLRALTLVLGEMWPGSYQPEDHEFFGRSSEGVDIRIQLEVDGVYCPRGCDSEVKRIIWTYDKDADKPCEFSCEADGCGHTWMSNDVRNQLTCMTVGVERNLSYQLSYTSKWTALSKLMRRFHTRLTDDEQRVEKLKGFYECLVETFHEVSEFKSFARSLRKAAEDFGGNLTYGLDIDFSAYDASNFFRSLRVFPHLDGEARAYDELGTGQEQVLGMAFSYAYAQAFGGEGLILAVEEPEAHLHPLAQEWIAVKLNELAEAGVQVVLTTHSPYFVDLSRPGTTVLARKSGEGHATTVMQLKPRELVQKITSMGAPADIVTVGNVGSFYENSATNEIKAGLFARACVLVEGPTEQLALPVLLSRLGVSLIQNGIAVIPVGSVNNIPKWVRYFRAHEIPVYPVFDSDSGKQGKDAANAKLARRDILLALGRMDVDDWDDLVQGPVGVGEDFAVFDSNYEGALRTVFGNVYESLEHEARQTVGSSKPLVARYVARRLPDPCIEDEDIKVAWDALRPLTTSCTRLIAREDRQTRSEPVEP
jgi:putative ATP-dependent endonuclease of the OLD family